MDDLKLFIGGLEGVNRISELKFLYLHDVTLVAARSLEHAKEINHSGCGMIQGSDLVLDEDGYLTLHE
jgi:hypothetical protein